MSPVPFFVREVPVSQVAPGRYAARFPVVDRGAYCMELTLDAGARTVFRQRAGLVVDYAEELKSRPADRELLRSMVGGGGSHDLKVSDVFAPSRRTAVRTAAAWPYLLALALLAFMFDIGLRRIVPAGEQAAVLVTLGVTNLHHAERDEYTPLRLLLNAAFMAVALAISAYMLDFKSAGVHSEPTHQVEKREPDGPDRPFDAAAAGRLCTKLGWRTAPAAAVSAGRVEPAGRAIGELAAEISLPGESVVTREPPEGTKAVEAVVRPEPIPLEHRRMIRRYFESIRPVDETSARSDG